MDLPELALGTPPLIAFALGALHVLEPAHGRSIINALLVGSRGRHYDVVKFGGAVIVSHLAVAFLLATIAWVVGHKIGENVVAPGFKLLGALITLFIGVVMLKCGRSSHTTCIHKHHGVEDSHDEHHEEVHASHMLQATVTSPTVLGFTGGLIPCQGTIALIAIAVTTGSLISAVFLLISFALGLGLCLIVVGLITVSARSKAMRLADKMGNSRFLALAPGIVVIAMGILGMVFSIAEIGGFHSHHGHTH